MIEFEISTNKKQIDFDITQGIPKYTPANFQTKNITITENGTTEVVADHGYDGLAKVSIETNVQDSRLLNAIKGMNSYNTTNYPFELTADMFDEDTTQIYQYKFIYNKNITNIETPTNITKIGNYAFDNCTALQKVKMPQVTSLGNYCFNNCTALQEVEFSPQLSSIPNYCFYNTKIKNFNFENVKTINERAFSGSGIIEENFPNLEYAYTQCFYRCNMKNANMPKLKYLGDYVFQVASVENVYAPIATSIGSACFDGSSLKTIIAPNIKTINNYGLAGTYMKEVDFPLLSNIYYSAFRLSKIEKINLALVKTLTSGYSFAYCYYLTTVIMSPEISAIGSSEFYECSKLAIVDFRNRTLETVPTLGGVNAFYRVPKTCKFIIPDELYEEWIASTNWVSLYNNGYQFIKASEYTEA